MLALSAFHLQEHPKTQRTTPANERKWEVIHAHLSDGRYLAVAVSEMVAKMMRHYDKDERQTDGSRHSDTMRPVFAQERARDFDPGFWLQLIHKGSSKKRLEDCKDNNGSPRSFQTIGWKTCFT